MASTIKVDNVQNQPGTNIINKCSVTTTIGAGAGDTINVCGATVNIGRCGGTVALACGATQTGFGRTGTVDWVTAIQTGTITAATGKGYFVNTTSGEITANLPAGAAGSIVAFKDYANTWDTNRVKVTPNGSEKIGGSTGSFYLTTESQSITLIYVDAAKGWMDIHDSTSDAEAGSYIVATGGNQPTSGGCIVDTDYKQHTFTGPGTFCITSGGGRIGVVDYLVVAGGGAGGNGSQSGGGGAGGYRESVPSCSAWTASPIAFSGNARPISPGPYSIVVGGGGAVGPGTSGPTAAGASGGVSSFSDIPSAGGGGGSSTDGPGTGLAGIAGGAGGGAGGAASGVGASQAGGAGDTPSVTPPQGKPGGYGGSDPGLSTGGGGGGATAAGEHCSPAPTSPPAAFAGGDGGTSSIDGTPTARGGGGGGGQYSGNYSGGAGGAGGGGYGGGFSPWSVYTGGAAGTVNTGGGGGGNSSPASPGSGNVGKAGGSGIVILRYKFQN